MSALYAAAVWLSEQVALPGTQLLVRSTGQHRYKRAGNLTTKRHTELAGTEVPENVYS